MLFSEVRFLGDAAFTRKPNDHQHGGRGISRGMWRAYHVRHTSKRLKSLESIAFIASMKYQAWNNIHEKELSGLIYNLWRFTHKFISNYHQVIFSSQIWKQFWLLKKQSNFQKLRWFLSWFVFIETAFTLMKILLQAMQVFCQFLSKFVLCLWYSENLFKGKTSQSDFLYTCILNFKLNFFEYLYLRIFTHDSHLSNFATTFSGGFFPKCVLQFHLLGTGHYWLLKIHVIDR